MKNAFGKLVSIIVVIACAIFAGVLDKSGNFAASLVMIATSCASIIAFMNFEAQSLRKIS